jgi:CheY-like chemotaxis protein
MISRQKSVLLVDDNPAVRKALCSMFESAGFACFESENCVEALQQAGELNPDLIVLDFSMPLMNGLEAAPLFKKKLPETPIIMFTMFASETFSKVAVAAGVSEVVSKEDSNGLMPRVELLLKAKIPL